jgi:hypothetical protein
MPLIEAVVTNIAHRAVNGDARARRDLLELLKRYPGTVQHQAPPPIINDTMSLEEAAEAYAQTLRYIPGVIEPDYEVSPWKGE